MWPETKKKVYAELRLLNRLLTECEPLRLRVCEDEPDYVELLAVAALLHSFYTGIENVFKRIALEIDGSVPSGSHSHAALLSLMTQANSKRPTVLSGHFAERLDGYMGFRHMFRHAYTYDLKWSKMCNLVLQMKDVLNQFAAELNVFFERARS